MRETCPPLGSRSTKVFCLIARSVIFQGLANKPIGGEQAAPFHFDMWPIGWPNPNLYGATDGYGGSDFFTDCPPLTAVTLEFVENGGEEKK